MPPVKHWPQSVSTQSTVPRPTSAPGLVRLTFSTPSVAARSRSMSRYRAERVAGSLSSLDQLVDGASAAAVFPVPMSSVACLLTSVAASRMARLAPTWMTGGKSESGLAGRLTRRLPRAKRSGSRAPSSSTIVVVDRDRRRCNNSRRRASPGQEREREAECDVADQRGPAAPRRAATTTPSPRKLRARSRREAPTARRTAVSTSRTPERVH